MLRTGKNKDGVTTGVFRPLYDVWYQIRRRCLDSEYKQYPDYGGRGISICDEWQNDFTAFYAWAIEAGWQRGLQVDREDNNKGYSPENCRITTPKKNSNNRRSSRFCYVDGQKMSFAEASEALGVARHTIKAWDYGTGNVPKPENVTIMPKGYY